MYINYVKLKLSLLKTILFSSIFFSTLHNFTLPFLNKTFEVAPVYQHSNFRHTLVFIYIQILHTATKLANLRERRRIIIRYLLRPPLLKSSRVYRLQ